MTVNFNKYGYIDPPVVTHVTEEVFSDIFVNQFGEQSTRHKLYKAYMQYLQEIKPLTTHSFSQWIDGSFVTNKINPNDIDVVSFIDYRDLENEKAWEKSFSGRNAREKFGVDGYIVTVYPVEHPKRFFYESDRAYWLSLFGNTRMNRKKQSFAKGIIEIQYDYEQR